MPRWRRKKIKGISDKQLDKVLNSERAVKALREKSNKVVSYWQSISPVFDASDAKEHRAAPPGGQPGDYRNSIKAIEKQDDDGNTYEHVVAKDFKAQWIEYGTSHMPEYAPLAKVKAKFRK